MSLPLAIFGITIDRGLFGKQPVGIGLAAMFDPFAAMKAEKVNTYGEGDFVPFDVVQLYTAPGDSTLPLGLLQLDPDAAQDLRLGQVLDYGMAGKFKVFGYALPKNWEEIGLKVIDDRYDTFTFALVEGGEPKQLVHLPLLAIKLAD